MQNKLKKVKLLNSKKIILERKPFWQKLNILEVLVTLLIFFIPLYPKFPLQTVAQTYVAIRLEDLLVATVVMVWLILEYKNGFKILHDKVSQLIILYWLIAALALLSALLITKNVIPHLGLLHYLRRIEYMSLFFVTYAAIRERENLLYLSSAFILSTVGVIIYGFGQKYFDWPVVSTMNREFAKGLLLKLEQWARINSTFAGHYDLAAYLVLILGLSAGLVFGAKAKKVKIGLLLVAFFSLYLLILTASRISYVGYLVAVVLTLVLLRKYWWIIPVVTISLIMMVFSTDIRERYALTFKLNLQDKLAFLPQLPQAPQQRLTVIVTIEPTITPEPTSQKELVEMTPVFSKEESTSTATVSAGITPWEQPSTEKAVAYSSGIRFQAEWPRALRAFTKNPFLGTGFSSVTLATDNDYLRALAETGLLGTISFGLIFLEITRRVILFLHEHKPGFEFAVVAGIAGAALGFLINALFIDVFEASKVAFVFWIMMGMLVKTMKL